MGWDWSYAWSCMPLLLKGLRITVEATILASIFAMVFGLICALLEGSSYRFVRNTTYAIVDFFRGTPFIAQLFFIFYVFPLWGIKLSAFATGVLSLSLYIGAFMAAVFRSGIDNIPKTQLEAADVLRLPLFIKWKSIILPQAIRMMIPSLGNYIIVGFKYSAVFSVITIQDLLGEALNMASESFRYMEPLTIAGLMYVVISIGAAFFINLIYKFLNKGSGAGWA